MNTRVGDRKYKNVELLNIEMPGGPNKKLMCDAEKEIKNALNNGYIFHGGPIQVSVGDRRNTYLILMQPMLRLEYEDNEDLNNENTHKSG